MAIQKTDLIMYYNHEELPLKGEYEKINGKGEDELISEEIYPHSLKS